MKNYEKYNLVDFLLDDYFLLWVKGESVEAKEFWEIWLKLHPEKKEVVNRARQLATSIDFEKTEDLSSIEDKVLDKVLITIRENGANFQTAKTKSLQLVYLKIAAAIIPFLILSFVLYYFGNQNLYDEVYANYGSTKTVVLPDQSIVTLNANSTLRYKKRWEEGNTREVFLEGEAFFEIEKTPIKATKFIVHTQNLDVEVLGTKFNVNTRREKTEVVLSTGKIKLKNKINDTAEDLYLSPGDIAVLDKEKGEIVKDHAQVERYISWKNNYLVFDKAPINELIELLEDNFGYQVELLTEIGENETFTATIPSKDPQVIIEILRKSYHLKIHKENNILTIK